MFKKRNSCKYLQRILPELRELATKLDICLSKANSLTAIVEFFQLISPWYDRLYELETGYTAGPYVAEFVLLRTHFKNAGRNKYGMNRTVKGENVTSANVFLGNIAGRFTLPVVQWIPKKDEAVQQQAKNFIKSHAPIIEIIKKLA